MTDPQQDDQSTMAKLAYDAYSQAVGGKAFNGDKLPDFSATPDTVKAGWAAAVDAVVGYLQDGPSAQD